MSLTDAQFEVFQQLVRRPFLVVDTEYTQVPRPGKRSADGPEDAVDTEDAASPADEPLDGPARERVISLAVVPVVRGRRAASGELYAEMNPGVPINPKTTEVHGFTDADVARKRPFAFYGQRLLDALSVKDAVVVTHTAGDVRILASELERAGLPQLPDLPLLDTSVLPRQLHYPGITGRGFVSLATLMQLTACRNDHPHNARSDARATADALLALLRHAATLGKHSDIDALLAAVEHGTTRAPRTGQYIRSSRTATPLPPEHLAEHAEPLTHSASKEELATWLERAGRCVQLRCEHLRTETTLAVHANSAALLKPLTALLPTATAPGQAGTLAGALRLLISPDDNGSDGGLAPSFALRWWNKARPRLLGAPPCGPKPDEQCPSCRSGEPCPRDSLYLAVTDLAIYGEARELTDKRINDRLLGSDPARAVNRWRENHPKELGYLLWVLANRAVGLKRNAEAQSILRDAVAAGVHRLEPRLALMHCESLLNNNERTEALAAAADALAHRTNDAAYAELAAWLVWQEHTVAPRRVAVARPITHPRLARPAGRRNQNPYLPT